MLSLAPLDPADLAQWLAKLTAAYVDERVRAGEPRANAEAKIARDDERLLPGGKPDPSQHFYQLLDDGAPVGWLWLGADSPENWWVYAIEIIEDVPRQGYGRAAMLLAEEESRAQGATHLGLRVSADNTTARSLYESLGYEMTAL